VERPSRLPAPPWSLQARRPLHNCPAAGRGPATSPAWGECERPGGDQSRAVSNPNLVAYTKALEAAGIVIKLVSRVPAPLKSIADQLIRSASSVPANLAEGHGRSGRDRQHHWRIAYASAKEVDSHLRLLAAAGAVNGIVAQEALAGFDQVRAMTWRLLNPVSA
jgi:four helix bundle protein